MASARKLLVLDVRGTLMCSFNARVSPHLFSAAIPLPGDPLFKQMIIKRPHLELFLDRMSELFDLVAFTSGAQCHAQKMIDAIDPNRKFFPSRLYQDSCKQGGKIKDLTVLGKPLEYVIMVDDTSSKCVLNPSNAVLISTFRSKNLETDRELLELMPFLESLASPEVGDVRPAIEARFGKKHEELQRQRELSRRSQKEAQPDEDDARRIKELGKALTKTLRHKAKDFNLQMRSDGFCKVDDLLKLKFKTRMQIPVMSHNRDEVLLAVERDNKKRMSTMVCEEDGALYIRANQGHSLELIDSEKLLREITNGDEFPVCVHGTYKHALGFIAREGLKRMGRKHIHLATGLPGADGVVSGMRSNCEVLVFVNVGRALVDGIRFFVSGNGVVLTEGLEGCLAPGYFDKVVEWPGDQEVSLSSYQAGDEATKYEGVH